MGTFSLSHAAKNDLRGIARFTEERWGRAQRRHYLKDLDEAFHMLANAPKMENACDYILKRSRGALGSSPNSCCDQ